jgi:hypothetical protein
MQRHYMDTQITPEPDFVPRLWFMTMFPLSMVEQEEAN